MMIRYRRITMRLPAPLEAGAERLMSTIDRRALIAAARRLSARYQSGDFRTPPLSTAADRAAYLLTRLPATFAANRHVFRRIREQASALAISSVLDLGAGPGTSLWAALEAFPGIAKAAAVERDHELAAWGQQLAVGSDSEALRTATWMNCDLSDYSSAPANATAAVAGALWPQGYDLIVMSYILGELSAVKAEALVAKAARTAAKAVVIIEPGTPKSFQTILAARQALIAAGLKLIAPCPHQQACPLALARDWCHFAERVERTAEHRMAKGGELGYEDEKFSYIAATRGDALWPEGRIVRHPHFHPGYVQLSLCTASGLEARTVAKSQKQSYRAARKTRWGDAWPVPAEP
jgi:ribosomal protein RSM22 (predicted rRNA methylase)